MDVSVCAPRDMSEEDLSAWRRLQRSDPALDNAFLSPEFALAMGRCVGNVEIGVFREPAEVVAFFPFQRGHVGIGWALGIGVSDAQAVICKPEFVVDLPELVRACGLGMWEFDHLVSHLDQVPTSEIPWAFVIDVRDGYDAYLSQQDRRKGRLFHSTMQKRRKLVREVGELHFEFDAADPAGLEALMRWKSAQFHRTACVDPFSRRWVRDLVHELATADEPGCRGTLSTLHAGSHLIAAHFGIRTSTRLSLWFPSYDTAFARYSPGMQLFFLMAESAPDHEVGLLDLSKGDMPYKHLLASFVYPVGFGRVELDPLSVLTREVVGGARRRMRGLETAHPHLAGLVPRSVSHDDRVH